MNPPNWLTMGRVVLAGVLMALLSINVPFAKSAALIVFLVAGFTDYLDGHLARKVYGVTSFGALMDPVADKILVCVALVSFVDLHVLPAWMVVVIIAREFLVTGLRLLATQRGLVISAGKWGKHKTAWQIIAISILLLGLSIRADILRQASAPTLANFDFVFQWLAWGLGLAVVLITVASGAMYYIEHHELVTRRQ